MTVRAARFLSVVLALSLAQAGAARRLLAAPPVSEEQPASQVHAAFEQGVQFQRKQDWGRAVVAFRAAASGAEGRNAAVIAYNIAVCERALGHFVAARQTLIALQARTADLDLARAEQAAQYLAEMEHLVARVRVELAPIPARLFVDGEPLVRDPVSPEHFLAGMSRMAIAVPSIELRTFELYLDPGAHIFRANRPGHKEAVVERSYHEGEVAGLQLMLDVLPATIAVKSAPTGAIVRIDGREVGITPLQVQRSAGHYQLEIQRQGHVLHQQELTLSSGQRADVTAPLKLYQAPLTAKWWFWTGVAAAVLGAGLGTYFIVRPEPQTPPYDGGSLGWVAQAR